MEFVEFQKKINEFQEKGINVITVTYDSISVLRSFSEKYQITYPMLSDVGSDVIKMYGIFNTTVDPAKRGFGIPNPGIYIIDKHFEKLYSERPTAENILVTRLHKKLNSNVQTFQTKYLTGSIGITDTLVRRAQLLAVIVEIALEDGFHIYGKPIPKGYIPLEIKFESNPNFDVDPFHFPETEEFVLSSLDETFNILPGKFVLKSFLRIKKRPQFGTYPINVSIAFQACDDKVCMFPEEFNFQFPLIIEK